MKLNRQEKRFHRCGSREALWQGMRAWYQTPVGRRLLSAEKQQLDALLPNLFGYHLLQVGRPADVDLLAASRISHCVVMDPVLGAAGTAGGESRLFGDPAALPVACDSLDVLVLPHVLEFSDDPHRVLREADRTLIPEGRLILLVFNPWSAWVLWRWSLGWRGRAPWCGRFLSITRVKDWLALLGFDVDFTAYYFYRPPLQKVAARDRLASLERLGARLWPVLGSAYVVVARKRVATLTPIRPRWKPRRRLVAPKLVEPYQGRMTRRRGAR